MRKFTIRGIVKRFHGQYGWYYVELDEQLSADLRPLVKERWPALLKASFKINSTEWSSSIMPIKDGLLFVALPAKIRKKEKIDEGQKVTVNCKIKV